jgi:DNA-binding IscR family transcriptional regulator
MAMQAIFRVAQRHFHGRQPVLSAELSVELGVPVAALDGVLQELRRRNLLVEVSGDKIAYVPARDLSTIRVDEVWNAIRAAHETRWLSMDRMETDEAINDMMLEIDDAVSNVIGTTTLKELVADHPPEPTMDEVVEREGSEPVPISSAKRDRGGQAGV